LSGREGFGFLSLSPVELVRWDLALFGKVKRLFSTTPKVEKQRRKSSVFLTEKTVTGRGPGWTCAFGQL
jgi:hypothetical protein